MEHSQTKRVKRRYQQILEVEILLQTFGISSIYYFGDNRYKCGLLSKHLFQIMQQHGGFTKTLGKYKLA